MGVGMGMLEQLKNKNPCLDYSIEGRQYDEIKDEW